MHSLRLRSVRWCCQPMRWWEVRSRGDTEARTRRRWTAGGLWQAAPAASAATDLRIVAYAVSGLFAVVGARLGASAALIALLTTAGAYLVVPWQWPRIATGAARLLSRLGNWLGQAPSTSPASGGEAGWQVATFLLVVLLGHLFGALLTDGPRPGPGRRLHSLADRLLGALFGCLAGLLVARFVLLRVAGSPVLDPWPAVRTEQGSLGATLAIAAVILLVGLYGVLSMGRRRPQVYDA